MSQDTRISQMSPAEKLRAAQKLYEFARGLKEMGLRAAHPEWSDDEVKRAVRRAFLLRED